jgi:hypothetical protein
MLSRAALMLQRVTLHEQGRGAHVGVFVLENVYDHIHDV